MMHVDVRLRRLGVVVEQVGWLCRVVVEGGCVGWLWRVVVEGGETAASPPPGKALQVGWLGPFHMGRQRPPMATNYRHTVGWGLHITIATSA